MPREGIIEGVATDKDGNPMGGALVTALNQETLESHQTTTNSNGEFSFDLPYGGTFHVIGRKDDGTNTLTGITRANVEVVSTIPDSAVADSNIIDHWDPISAFEGADGDSITSWDGGLGNLTVTGGSPSVLDNGINGNTSLDFGSGDNSLSTDFSSPEGQPFGVFFVFQIPTLPSSIESPLGSKNSNSTQVFYSTSDDAFGSFAGNTLTGPSLTDTTVPIVGFYGFDGSNSIIRNNQTEVTGSVGSGSLDGVSFGSLNDSERFWSGLLGEIVLTNTIPSQSTIEDEEQRMADRWGITL